jgi:hypothetical protein
VLVAGGPVYDFSENNVKECEWYGSSCDGGNYWRVASFLASNGTVLESCDPYVAGDVACNSSCPYQKTLLDWRVISWDVPPDASVLKTYIQTYGPVYTTMNAGHYDAWHTEFQNYDGSYTLYYTGTEETNHAVLIVGWDDDLVHAGGQGGWIVKNSWGTGWGGTCGYGTEGGYFTIDYGSAKIGSYSSYVYEWQDHDPGEIVLYHDEGGYTSSVGYGITTAWGLCKFVPGEDIEIERVEFWTLDTVTDADVLVYDDFNGSSASNLLGCELNRTFDHAGYHSVELGSPISVETGEDIYAVVKLTDASYTYPIAFDVFGPKASGCCYISATGATYSAWTNGDLGIRLRASREGLCSGMMEPPFIMTAHDVPGDAGGYVNLSWKRSIFDADGSTPEIKRYRVWRRRREFLPTILTLGDGIGATLDGPFEHGLTGPAWEVVGTLPATGSCSYSFDAPTYCDSSASSDCWTRFYITAHTGAIGEHFDSPVDSGYSVDNLGMLRSPKGDRDGRIDIGPADHTHLEIPEPNPGAGGITIRFGLSEDDWVELEVYDITGRRVALVLEGLVRAGEHQVVWDAVSDTRQMLSPGVYFVRLVTTPEVETVKIVLY